MILVALLILVIAAVLVLVFLGGVRFGYVKAERDLALKELREYKDGRR